MFALPCCCAVGQAGWQPWVMMVTSPSLSNPAAHGGELAAAVISPSSGVIAELHAVLVTWRDLWGLCGAISVLTTAPPPMEKGF